MVTAAQLRLTAIVLLLSLSSAVKLKTFNAVYPNFNDTAYYHTIFEVVKPATINNGALQITLDTAANDPSLLNLSNQSGRILLNKRFQLWKGKNPTRVASFNSSFLINIYRLNNASSGDGLAFIIAPDLTLPANSSGQYLGLTNSSTDGQASNRIVAVELDTFKDNFDPDDNHVGLNVNSVRSLNVTSLKDDGIVLAPSDGARFYNVWVQYDGIEKVIEVYIAEQLKKYGETPAKPTNPVLKSKLELKGVVDQYSYFGFAASTGITTQLNCVLRWNLTVQHYAKDKMRVVLVVGLPIIVLSVLSILGAAIFGYYIYRKRRAESNPIILGALRTLPGTPREFNFKDLKKATDNFSEKNKLGEGGYGVVYRGLLANEHLEVAVKWFSRESLKGEDDFLAELTIINRLRHKHLVKLLGWCHKNRKLLLVYDYMPNGCLDSHLFGEDDNKLLSWTLRYKIVSNVALALNYLHNEYDQRVVHRDLKASNILLDLDFNARLGDFGLARALENEKTSYAETAGVLGTMGYIAPECFHTGCATKQSDVYAFGAILLETVSGRRPGSKIGGYQYLVDYIWSLHREGRLLEAVDKRLRDDYDVAEAQRLLLLGLACSNPIAIDRPETQDIVQIIMGSLPVPHVRPFRPAFVWSSMPVEDISLTTSTDARSFETIDMESGRAPFSRGSYTSNSDK